MEDLREEIEKEISRTKAQISSCKSDKSDTLKLIAQGRLIAYSNVLEIMDRL